MCHGPRPRGVAHEGATASRVRPSVAGSRGSLWKRRFPTWGSCRRTVGGCPPRGVPRLVGAARTDPVRPQLRPQDARGCSDPNRFPRGRGSCEQARAGWGGRSQCAPWPVHGQRSDQVPEPGVGGGEAGIRLLGFTLFFSFLKDFYLRAALALGEPGSRPPAPLSLKQQNPLRSRGQRGWGLVSESSGCAGVPGGPPKPQRPQVLACGAAARVCGQEGARGGAGAGRDEHLSPPPLTCRVGGLVPPGAGGRPGGTDLATEPWALPPGSSGGRRDPLPAGKRRPPHTPQVRHPSWVSRQTQPLASVDKATEGRQRGGNVG